MTPGPDATFGGGASGPRTAMAGWIQDVVPYGIFTTDTDLRVDSWNQWLVQHSGFSAEDVVGRHVGAVVPDLAERRLEERFVRALAGEVSVLSAALHQFLLPLAPDVPGAAVPHMLQTARIAPLAEGGRITGTITIIEDVTQREVQSAILHRQQELDRLLSAALAALLQSNDPARDVAEIFPRLMPSLGLDAYFSYLLGASGTVLHLNAAGGISPRQRESLAALPVHAEDSVVVRSGAPALPATLREHVRLLEGIGLRGHCSFPLVVGERVIGLVSFASYELPSIPADDLKVLSRIARYVAVALDRAMRERDALAASRAKDDFLAALSHELRTPLNPVLLLASDCAANPDYPAEAREAFSVIEKNALLEARLIDDLLDLTRIEHGKVGLETQVVDVHGPLRDALVTVRADAAARQLAIELDLQAEVSAVLGDSGRLQQVFWNILKNAVKFTPVGGRIHVRSRLDHNRQEIEISVTDTGIGLEEQEVERIFGAFVQGSHAQHGRAHRFGGLGLGLAISRKLVELHLGRIDAVSGGRDQGATFTVRLPVTNPMGHEPPPRSESPSLSPPTGKAPVASAPVPAPSIGRILLVEDHEPTRAPLARLLTRRGYAVVPVASVAEAVAQAAAQPFDLVLSDIGLPDGDGFELMEILRDRYGLKGIALTGYGMQEDVVRSNQAGFMAHLTKPISVASLDRTLAAAFAGR